VTWKLVPTLGDGCPPDYPEFEGDRIRVEVVAPSGQPRLGFDDWRVRAPPRASAIGDSMTVVGLAPGRTLADLREDPSAARRVVADQLDAPMLRLDDDLGRLYFADADATLELVGEGATPVDPAEPVPPENYVTELRLAGERPLVLAAGGHARIQATLPGGLVLESPELIAVSAEEATELDLVVAVTSSGAPAYAYAEVRDGQDRVLHAAPIEWGMAEGALSLIPGDLGSDGRTGEYLTIQGGCEPPSETESIERHAVLRARLGPLEDTVDLVWTEQPRPPSIFSDHFQPDPTCVFGDEFGGDDGSGADDPLVEDHGCGCSTDRESPTAPALVSLLALVFIRRRRRDGR
jgi:MYXO-CTERM domain-containing protein